MGSWGNFRNPLTGRRVGCVFFIFLCPLLLLYFSVRGVPSSHAEKGSPSTNNFYSEENPHFCVPSSKSEYSPLCDSAHQRLSSVLVTGALHFVGAKLVSHLATLGKDVRALASYKSILHDEELVWYRDQELQKLHRLSVEVANLSNSTVVEGVLRKNNPSEIVFVPPGVGRELVTSRLECSTIDNIMSRSLEELVLVLENARTASPCARVVLMSHSKLNTTAVQASRQWMSYLAWVETFELVMSTFHNLYRVPIGIFRFSGVHGPWSEALLHRFRNGAKSASRDYCWYVDDVMTLVVGFMKQPGGCLVSELESCSSCSARNDQNLAERILQSSDVQDSNWGKSMAWVQSYKTDRHSLNSKVLVPYFTGTDGRPNHFQHMAQFYWSLKKHRLKAVVFHDGLHPEFQHRLSSDYPKLSFIKVNSLHNRSTNDARFYAYYQYLREHPEIDRVLLTDISDVEIQKDPFQLMSLLGDWLYVGTDIDIFPNMNSMPWIEERLRGCFGNHSIEAGKLSKLMRMETVYNAGTIGGSRETVLNLLAVMVAYLDSTPASLNCNMPSLNFAVHEHFFEKVFTGFPLTSRFLQYQSTAKGVYLVHK